MGSDDAEIPALGKPRPRRVPPHEAPQFPHVTAVEAPPGAGGGAGEAGNLQGGSDCGGGRKGRGVNGGVRE